VVGDGIGGRAALRGKLVRHLCEQALKVVLVDDFDSAWGDSSPDPFAVGGDATLYVKKVGRRLCRRRHHPRDGHHPRGPAHQHEIGRLGKRKEQH